MNIRTIQCPSCGANLQFEDRNQSLFYCNYCGAAIQIETNHNKGYDMEMGRLDARGELADSVIEKIESIKDKLIINGNAKYSMESYPMQIAELRDNLHYERTSGWGDAIFKPFLKGLGLLLLASIFIVSLYSILPGPIMTIFEIVSLALPIGLPALKIISKLKNIKIIKSGIEQYNNRLNEAKRIYEETEAFLRENAEVDIPPHFRHEGALNYILKGLKAREFVSLEQAFFRFDETYGTDDSVFRFHPI
ncbi:MAG: hypothetical protein J6X66_06930 [Lachnospiraceae bacterium]|nr:hypothetical protein [Lachnospiraceae bacterium]